MEEAAVSNAAPVTFPHATCSFVRSLFVFSIRWAPGIARCKAQDVIEVASVTIGYVVRRFGIFLLIVITAVTLNFFLPRIRSTNPIESRMNQLAAQGGVYANQ